MRFKINIIIFLVITGSLAFVAKSNANIEGTNLLISEVLYDAPNDDTTEEWIEIYNPTTSDISIDGWSIEDNYDSNSLTGIVPAGGFLVLAKDSDAFYNLYGYYPDQAGLTLALSNSGDKLTLYDDLGNEVDFVAWENYVTGWGVSAVDTTIRRISATDTDTVDDWEDSLTLGDPGAGDYGTSEPDTTPPTVTFTNPLEGETVSGTVLVSIDATDESSIVSYEIYINGILKASTSSYSWNTVYEEDGTYTLTGKAQDSAGNWGETTITVTVNNTDYQPPAVGAIKIMTYNIEESGINPDWKEVVKEENPDIVVFVETGTWDDDNNALLNQYVDEFNSYFVNEDPYVGYTAQDIVYSTSGEAIMSRFPILDSIQLPIVTLDDGTAYDVTHDFMVWPIDIGGMVVYVIGAHLKASSGDDNEWRREREQEGILNYMDSLADYPIIYMGDLNSFSPEDTGDLAPSGDLGYGPMTMTIWPDDPIYGQYSSQAHNLTDVFRTLNPTDPGYTYPDVLYESRIDYIVVNQYLSNYLINSTVGDTPSADTGSDHYCVDMFIDFGALLGSTDDIPPAQVTGLTGEAVSSSQIDLSWNPNSEDDISYYKIYRDGVIVAQVSKTTYSDTGLTAATTYTYEVSAVDLSGNEGEKSALISVTTLEDSPNTDVMYVESILTGEYVGRRDPVFTETDSFELKDTVVIRVAIVDYYGNPVEGATVTITITTPSGDTITLTAVTDASGIAEFSYRLLPNDETGIYTISITDVTIDTLTYDPTLNVESTEEFSVS
ncbi:MAG: lamin tail domain-containing protein [Candidatus Heimdallarchaeaceae archaeon]